MALCCDSEAVASIMIMAQRQDKLSGIQNSLSAGRPWTTVKAMIEPKK